MVRRTSVRLGLVLVLVLIGTELVLRLGLGLGDPPLVSLNDQTEYQLVPDRQYKRFGNRIIINRYGMRSDDIPATPRLEDRRVLLIGDSVIYGNHSLDQSETISLRLQSRLESASRLKGCDPLIMTAAVSSWGPVNQAAFLKKVGLLDASMGIIVLSAHDLYDTPHFGTVIPYRTNAPWNAIDDARVILQDRLTKRPLPETSYEDRRTLTLAAMDQIARQFEQANIPLVLAYHPTVSERSNGNTEAKNTIINWATERSLTVIDLETADLTQDFYRDDIHPNAKGADAISAIFADYLTSQLDACS